MTMFKVGDIITGDEGADREYSYTTSEVKMVVTNISNNGETIAVKILETSKDGYRDVIGREFMVNSKYFKLVEKEDNFEKKFIGFRIGDIVKGTRGEGYGMSYDNLIKALVLEVLDNGDMQVYPLEHEDERTAYYSVIRVPCNKFELVENGKVYKCLN